MASADARHESMMCGCWMPTGVLPMAEAEPAPFVRRAADSQTGRLATGDVASSVANMVVRGEPETSGSLARGGSGR